MPSQSWETVLNYGLVGAGLPYVNSVTLTDVSAAPQSILAANQFIPGSKIRLTASGTITAVATPTLLLGFYYGGVAGVALATTGAVTLTTTATGWSWRIEYTGEVRTTGSAGTIMGGGIANIGTSLTTVLNVPMPVTAQAVVAIDTTTAKAITIGAQWGTAAAGNTLLCNHFIIESIGA